MQEKSLTAKLFTILTQQPKSPFILYLANKYVGESFYQAAKIPIGFDAQGNALKELEQVVKSVRVDADKQIVVLLVEAKKTLDHQKGDSGAVLGTAPFTTGFVAMSTYNCKRGTTLLEIPSNLPKEMPYQQRPNKRTVYEEKQPENKPQQYPENKEPWNTPESYPVPFNPQNSNSQNQNPPVVGQPSDTGRNQAAVDSGRFYDPAKDGKDSSVVQNGGSVSRDSSDSSERMYAEARVSEKTPQAQGKCF